jgi:hypothetical protein
MPLGSAWPELRLPTFITALRGLNYIILDKPLRPIAATSWIPRRTVGLAADQVAVETASSTIKWEAKTRTAAGEPAAHAPGLDPDAQVRPLSAPRPAPDRPAHQEIRAK